MNDTGADRDELLNELADDFAARYRRGERPALTEYVARHPELAAEIRDFFPAVVEMEGAKAAAESSLTRDESQIPSLEHLGDFRILREIGHGGMGVVYEAEQISLGRRVALKLLTQRMLRDGVQKRRFEREAKAAARLHHSNIVPVFGSGEHEGTPYYVMQFIHGLGLDVVAEEIGRLQGDGSVAVRRDVSEVAHSLMTGAFRADEPSESTGSVPQARAVADTSGVAVSMTRPDSSAGSHDRKPRKLSYWQGVARIGVQVADALEYAHRQGIIHRDIKPSNLLLDLNGTAWVTDFGLAKGDDGDNLTRTGDVLGTLRYMPPEAFDGKTDARGDVYGLGITLYELLALRPAYDQHDRNKLIKAVTTSEPPRLRTVRPAVPRDLETIVHKSLDHEPARRYRTAGELAADLQRFLNDEPIKAREISTRERAWRWCKRYPFDAALLGLLAVVFLAGFVGVVWQWRKAVAETARAKLAEEQTATTLYYSNIARARLEQQANNTRGAEAILDRCPPRLRGWEWHYLKGLSHADLLTLKGDRGWIFAVAYSPDGRLIAAAGGGNPYWVTQGPDSVVPGDVILWDADTGARVRTLRGHGHSVQAVAFGPDGTRLATISPDDTLRVWDVASGRELRQFRRNNEGKPSDFLFGVPFSPDGQRVASNDAGGVTLWPVSGEGLPQRLRAPAEPEAEVSQRLAFTSDGRRLVCQGRPRNSARGMAWVWDLADGKVMRLESPQAIGNGFAVSPDDRHLAAAADSVIKVWDLTTGRLARTLTGHHEQVEALAFSPDGLRLASGGLDCTVRLWDLNSGKEVTKILGHTGRVLTLAFSPGGERLASGGADNTVKVWDLTSVPEFHGPSISFWGDRDAIAFTADDRGLIVCNRSFLSSVAAIDSDSRAVIDGRHIPIDGRWTTPAAPACFDGQARWLVGATKYDRTVVGCYDVATGRQRVLLRGHTQPVWHVAMTDDGRRIATGSPRPRRPQLPGEFKVWDVDSGAPLLEVSEAGVGVTAVAVGPAGEFAAVATQSGDKSADEADTLVRVYAVATGRPVHAVTVEKEAVYALAFDPSGSRLIAAGDRDTVLFLELSTGRATSTHQGTPMAQDIAVSPDGRRIAIAGRTMTKLLDTVTGEEILSLTDSLQTPGNTSGYNPRVRWSHDGRRLAVNSSGPFVNVWSAGADGPASGADRLKAVLRRATDEHAWFAGSIYDVSEWSRRFHLDRIRDAELSGAWDYANRGTGYFLVGDDGRARADFGRAVALNPLVGVRLCECGNRAVQTQQYDRAAEYFALGMAASQPNGNDTQRALAVFAYAKAELYRRHARSLFERLDTSGGERQFQTLIAYVVRPDSGIDAAEFLQLCRRLRSTPETAHRYCPPWCLGLAELRASDFSAALAAFDAGAAECRREILHPLRALAFIGLGRMDEARAALDEHAKVSYDPADPWHWLLGQTLRREAEGLLAKQ